MIKNKLLILLFSLLMVNTVVVMEAGQGKKGKSEVVQKLKAKYVFKKGKKNQEMKDQAAKARG